jgi:hypothetical protein
MNIDFQGQLIIDGLPSPERLAALHERGVRRLINLCGVDLREIYGRDAVTPFHCSLHVFADLFSDGTPATGEEDWTGVDVNLYLSKAPRPSEREQLLGAVKALQTALIRKEPVFVFCNHGRGRSPLVATAALYRLGGVSLAEIVRRVQRLQPRAVFTRVGLAAVRWTHERAGVLLP